MRKNEKNGQRPNEVFCVLFKFSSQPGSVDQKRTPAYPYRVWERKYFMYFCQRKFIEFWDRQKQ